MTKRTKDEQPIQNAADLTGLILKMLSDELKRRTPEGGVPQSIAMDHVGSHKYLIRTQMWGRYFDIHIMRRVVPRPSRVKPRINSEDNT